MKSREARVRSGRSRSRRSDRFRSSRVVVGVWPVVPARSGPGIGWTIAAVFFVASGVAAAEQLREPVDYAVVVTGEELLTGVYADSHTFFLTRTLRPFGFRCVGSLSVADKRSEIHRALRFFADRTRLIVVTGGLGPTDTDITREVLSEFTGMALKESPEVLRHLERRFGTPRDQLRRNVRRQARVPVEGTFLKNRTGTAVGLVFPSEPTVVALPGPPRELRPMVLHELMPYLARRFGARPPGCSIRLRFVNIGQSRITQVLHQKVKLDPDVLQTSQFRAGRVDFTFSLPEDTPAARERLARLKGRIRRYLGDYIYADDDTTLEARVLELLRQRRQTLGLAECATGGLLSAALSAAPGSRNLAGAVAAPSERRLWALLGAAGSVPVGSLAEPNESAPRPGTVERYRRLARLAAQATSSDWTVAVGAPLRDEQTTAAVAVAIRKPDGSVLVFWSSFVEDEEGRARLVTRILDRLRRELLAVSRP
ncbi:MAG TPA: hypothetical protein EYP14_15885 [Planctomycetaceae bacterium]|nr:hypothetical protein [Planctomycetaceae bacterium]